MTKLVHVFLLVAVLLPSTLLLKSVWDGTAYWILLEIAGRGSGVERLVTDEYVAALASDPKLLKQTLTLNEQLMAAARNQQINAVINNRYHAFADAVCWLVELLMLVGVIRYFRKVRTPDSGADRNKSLG